MLAPFLPWSAGDLQRPLLLHRAGLRRRPRIVVAWLVRRSRFGLQLRAIRDDEDRARGLGVRTMRVKLTAFVLSGAITGLVGGVWFFYISQVAAAARDSTRCSTCPWC